MGEVALPWSDGGDPDPWALGKCGLRGCQCSEEARAAIALAAARLLSSARALAGEQDAEFFPRSAEAAARLAASCEGLLLDALELQ